MNTALQETFNKSQASTHTLKSDLGAQEFYIRKTFRKIIDVRLGLFMHRVVLVGPKSSFHAVSWENPVFSHKSGRIRLFEGIL